MVDSVSLREKAAYQAGQLKSFHGGNVRFFLHTEKDELASEKAGIPKYKEIEMVGVRYPGQGEHCVTATEKHRTEYAEIYKAFKEGLEPPTEGMPLTEWPPIPRPVVEELRYFGFKTVEQLAGATDETKRRIGPLADWCKPAKKWLEAANSSQAQVAKIKALLEVEERKRKKLEDQVALLFQKIETYEGVKLHDVTA